MPTPVDFLKKPVKALVIVVRLEVWLPSRLKGGVIPDPPPATEGEWLLLAGIWDDQGFWDDSAIWNDEGAQLPDPPVNTGLPVVTGSLIQGSTLSCSTGSWTNSPTGYAYQWLNAGASIVGATFNVYNTQPEDVGDLISCRVTALNAGGSSSPATSAAVGPITAALAPPVNTALPVITGSLVQGSTLSCSTGSWTNNPTSYAYQWLNAGSPIPNATASTYATVAGDVGDMISCQVVAANAAGSDQASATAVGPIQSALSTPVNSALPVVTGSLVQGSTLSCSTGSWTNSPTSYAYQWLNAGVPISGATSSTYATVAGDVGDMISCQVVATNAAGSSSPAVSAAVGPIEAAAPDASKYTDGTQYTDGTGFLEIFQDEMTTLSLDSAKDGGENWVWHWVGWNAWALDDNGDKAWKTWSGHRPTAGAQTPAEQYPALGANVIHEATGSGTIKIYARPNLDAANWFGYPYLGGMISTELSHWQLYGEWEFRAMATVTKGQHVALGWLLQKDGAWPPELDMCELVNDGTSNTQRRIFMNRHAIAPKPVMTAHNGSTWDSTNGIGWVQLASDAEWQDWHVYKLVWSATTIEWYLDGVLRFSCQNYITQPMYWMGSWEIGSDVAWSWPGVPDGTTVWPAVAEYDYVRITGA